MSCSKSTTLCFRSAGCRRFQRNLARRYNSYVPGSTRTFRESDLFLSGVSSARSSCAMLRAISSWTDNTSRSELNADVQTREASEARQEKQGTTQGAVSAILAQLPNPPSFYCSGSSVFSFICRITSFNCLRNAVSLTFGPALTQLVAAPRPRPPRGLPQPIRPTRITSSPPAWT